ncbi:MAG: single-stranded DNA-binding protein [Frankiales bacterium]|nr:single-stranded DNA-binding protein [Frankiales bacterium]
MNQTDTSQTSETKPAELDVDPDVTADADLDAQEEGEADDLLVQEGDIAGDYLERLLDIVDADGDIDMDVENDRAVVAIVGDGLDSLVGHNGVVLDALQELTRLAVVQQTGVRSRLMLDIGGWRAMRKTELTGVGTKAAARALESGEPVPLAPMTPFERKIVHDAIAAIPGVSSESEGVAPERRVVVVPDAAAPGAGGA